MQGIIATSDDCGEEILVTGKSMLGATKMKKDIDPISLKCSKKVKK